MKFTNLKYVLLFAIIILLGSCFKETSYEKGANVYGFSSGTLKDSLGDCKGIVIKGAYQAGTVLTDSNYIIVGVNITQSGKYVIYSDTVNGFWFRDSGYVAVGTNTIKIKAFGTPVSNVNADFVVTYNNSVCLFSITAGIVAPLPIISDYFPRSIGSNWGYNVLGLDSLHTKSTPKDTILGGNSYRVFYANGSLDDTAFYRKSGGDYYRWDALDGNTGYMPLLFLKEDKPAGTQWESNIANTVYSGIPTQVKMKYTLMSVNVSRTVESNTFDSVIHVKNELQYKILGTFQTIQTMNTYFAKNVGLIEFEAAGIYQQKLRRWKVY
ncbi:MAG TPA: hypothetical protein PKG56_06695 [Chitinophagaceae bacterium]|nr:hypothetical protein [Chitinophagaceae bacterium]HMZ46865.1 hypothetical protein [Chitinophagaceae bacterium]HNF29244.1 hypothetical protein [Chitinophagaceae bacterium]HNL83064.1 hypothetical protein [Chitinophagaceae bacterium]HNM34451.1 hypothetical protein [Chitinophagaceae bacterium]